MRAFMLPRDIGLFLRSARTDAQIRQLRPSLGAGGALEAIYAANPDPWASGSPKYRYQQRKYEVLASLLPTGRYRRALDVGCGSGLLTRHLASHAESVLGVDISPTAVANARSIHADKSSISFEAHDLLDFPSSFDNRFDLIVVADVLYYLSPLSDSLLEELAVRISRMLTVGGTCMLANHYFFKLDPDSRRSRRIHDAFKSSSGFLLRADYWRPFYLVTLLSETSKTIGRTHRSTVSSATRLPAHRLIDGRHAK